jgi:hypothetical protein
MTTRFILGVILGVASYYTFLPAKRGRGREIRGNSEPTPLLRSISLRGGGKVADLFSPAMLSSAMNPCPAMYGD